MYYNGLFMTILFWLNRVFFSLEVVSRLYQDTLFVLFIFQKKYALTSCIHETVQQEYNWNMRKRILYIYIDRKGHIGFQGQLVYTLVGLLRTITEMVPDLIWAPDFFGPREIWSPRNSGPTKIGSCMKMIYNDFYVGTKFLRAQTSPGSNFLGLKFLGDRISQGPKWGRGPFQLQPF